MIGTMQTKAAAVMSRMSFHLLHSAYVCTKSSASKLGCTGGQAGSDEETRGAIEDEIFIDGEEGCIRYVSGMDIY
jgi:hypothetical protein